MTEVLRFLSRGMSRSRLKALYKVCSQHKNISSRSVHFSTRLSCEVKFLEEPDIQKLLDAVCDGDGLIKHISTDRRKEVSEIAEKRKEIRHNILNLEELIKEASNDEELKGSAKLEVEMFRSNLSETENDLIAAMMPDMESDCMNEVVLEVNPGVGGQEAMLFTRSIFDMYMNYATFKGWESCLAQLDTTQLGGVRQATLFVQGRQVLSRLLSESGVHRVQRVPSTDATGRIHTSTVTVVVLPQPRDIDVRLEDKHLKIETKRATGAGGQHVNTTDSAVRITHLPTRTVVECQIDRSQIKNKEIALKRLRAKLSEIESSSQSEEMQRLRKSQAGIGSRSDKVRTYNFNQDRVTDHRLKCNFHNVEGFLQGGKLLDTAIDKLFQLNSDRRKQEFLENLIKSMPS